MMKMQTSSKTFFLQARTEKAVTSDGTETNATTFTAFVAKDGSNASIQVELSSNKTCKFDSCLIPLKQ